MFVDVLGRLLLGITDGKFVCYGPIVGDDEFDGFALFQFHQFRIEHESHRIEHRYLDPAIRIAIAGFAARIVPSYSVR